MTRDRSRPNLIWIFPDQWRFDAFGAAGNTVVRTPNIDALARRGLQFRNAYCESPVCMSSRASLLTGSFPSDHGLFDNMNFAEAGTPPPPDAPNFLHALKKAGYRTAEIGKMHFFPGREHIRRPDALTLFGFDDIAEEFDKYALWQRNTPYTDYLRERGLFEQWAEYTKSLALPRAADPVAAPEVVPAEDTLDAFIGRSAAAYIEEHDGDEPFFLWVAPIGPHMPYDGPPPYSDLYQPEDIPLGDTRIDRSLPDNQWGDYVAHTLEHHGCAAWTEDTFRLIGKHYYASITLIDDQVGRIVKALEASGRDRDTWILISSDHGEMLGDHGSYAKRLFYRGSVQVPLIVVPPVGQDIGRVYDHPVQGIDVPGTMIDLAGVEWLGPASSGRSLVDAVDSRALAREAVYSEISEFLMVATGEHKLVVHRPTGEAQVLYDLAADPDERTDVLASPAHKDVAEHLTSLAHDFLHRRGRL